jgi:mandelate racemase
MSTTTATIRSVKARAVVAPITRPVKNAFGVIEAAPLVLIDVATDRGVTGRSYIFAYAKLTLAPLVHLIEQIGGDLTGKAVALRRTIQTVGWVERSDTHHLYPSA